MVKRKWISVLVLLALLLASCETGGNRQTQDTGNATGENLTDNTAQPRLTPTAGLQSGNNQTLVPEITPTEAAFQSVLGSNLLQAEVRDDTAQPLGVIRGMVMEPAAGQVRYVVVQPDSKSGDRLVLVPWHVIALQVPGAQGGQTAIRMRVDNETVAKAPDFTGADFQGEAALDWDAGIEKYWASTLSALPVTGYPSPEESAPVTGLSSMPVLLGDLENGQEINFEVQDPEGKTLGTILDLVVSGSGQVQYGLLTPDPEHGAVFGRAGGQVVISWKAMGWNPDDRTFVLSAPAEALAGAPHLEESRVPDMTLPGWDNDWSTYWENTELRGPQATRAAVTPLPENTSTGDPGSGSQGSAGQSGDTAPQQVLIPVRLSRLIDQKVTTNSGEVLGIVADIVLSPGGVVEYLVLATQAGPGQGRGNEGNNPGNNSGRGNSGQGNRARGNNEGGKLVPMPWTALNWSPQEGSLEFTKPVTVYNSAPAFDGPETFGLEEDWWLETGQYWKTFVIIPTADASPQENARLRAGDVFQKEVRGAQDEVLGTVDDLLVDETGVVSYLVLRDQDNTFRAVPWAFFRYDSEAARMLYTDDVERLRESPAFPSVQDFDSTDAGQVEDLLTYWGRN